MAEIHGIWNPLSPIQSDTLKVTPVIEAKTP
jgi:hypothetical protein